LKYYQPLNDVLETLQWERDKNSLESLGIALAKLVSRAQPFSYRYLRSVLYGNYQPGKPLKNAIDIAGAVLDGLPLTMAEAKKISVYAPPGLDAENAYLVMGARICANKKCFNRFIPNHPSRMYCYCCRPRTQKT
jgi:hypothetical protein